MKIKKREGGDWISIDSPEKHSRNREKEPPSGNPNPKNSQTLDLQRKIAARD